MFAFPTKIARKSTSGIRLDVRTPSPIRLLPMQHSNVCPDPTMVAPFIAVRRRPFCRRRLRFMGKLCRVLRRRAIAQTRIATIIGWRCTVWRRLSAPSSKFVIWTMESMRFVSTSQKIVPAMQRRPSTRPTRASKKRDSCGAINAQRSPYCLQVGSNNKMAARRTKKNTLFLKY